MKLLSYRGKRWVIALEYKLQDLWIGAYWESHPIRFKVWICVIPCFPIFIGYWR